MSKLRDPIVKMCIWGNISRAEVFAYLAGGCVNLVYTLSGLIYELTCNSFIARVLIYCLTGAVACWPGFMNVMKISHLNVTSNCNNQLVINYYFIS